MPIITFESGQLTEALRKQLIQALTDAAVSITGTPAEYFFVTIKEYPDDAIAIGGVTVTEIKKKIKK